MKPSFRKFPYFTDSYGRKVFVRVTSAGTVQFRSQSNRKRQIDLSALWEALLAPEAFLEAVADARRAALKVSEVGQATFADIEASFAKPGQGVGK